MIANNINQFDDLIGMVMLFMCVNLMCFFAGMWVQRYKDKNSK